MAILVTGAAGFIGSNICKRLLGENKASTIVGIDNYNPFYSVSLKKRRIEELEKYKNFVFIQSSFYRKQTLLSIQKKYKPTTLIHAAAEVGVRNGELHPLSYIKTNVLGTSMLLETIGTHLRHIVLLSSSSVYGNAKFPFRETATLHPMSVYGVSKTCMESYAKNYFSRKRTPVSIVRPFSVYGPDGRPDMLPMKLLITSLANRSIVVAGKYVRRDWTYINDVVSAIVRIAANPTGLQYINIGSGKPLSNDFILKTAKNNIEAFGYQLHYTFASQNPIEIPTTWADNKTLRHEYAVPMTTGFEQGFQKTAAFFFSNKHFYIGYV